MNSQDVRTRTLRAVMTCARELTAIVNEANEKGIEDKPQGSAAVVALMLKGFADGMCHRILHDGESLSLEDMEMVTDVLCEAPTEE